MNVQYVILSDKFHFFLVIFIVLGKMGKSLLDGLALGEFMLLEAPFLHLSEVNDVTLASHRRFSPRAGRLEQLIMCSGLIVAVDL